MIRGFWNRLFKRDTLTPTQSQTLEWQAMGRARHPDAVFPHHTNSFWMNSRGVGLDLGGRLYVNEQPVTREEFDAYLKGAKIDDLKSEIERNRRNKKKISHLVAELAELENGK